jgi:hypothetical protein
MLLRFCGGINRYREIENGRVITMLYLVIFLKGFNSKFINLEAISVYFTTTWKGYSNKI